MINITLLKNRIKLVTLLDLSYIQYNGLHKNNNYLIFFIYLITLKTFFKLI